ncbi:MAG: efflux RND transporter permease subunit [Candidatus Eremiobacteraeota bacterium]|nr:efflux RND transporter permease subunit [Candidatus Eremiobacteraeota bacterium]
MRFANFAMQHARGILFTLGVLVVLGLVSVRTLPMSIYPKVAFSRVVIVAQNGEMAPAQVQQNITRPIEQAVSTVIGSQVVQANSAQGSGQISITFDPNIDVNLDLQRVNAALSQATIALPPGTNVVAQIVNPNIFPVLGYVVDIPGKTLTEIRNISEYQLRPLLSGLPGIAQVRTVGGRIKEYWVSVDPRQAAALKIPLGDIGSAIAANNQVTSVGHFNAFDQRQTVLVSGVPRTPADIEGIVVNNRGGTPITVGQIATVHDALEPKTAIVSANGRDSVLLNVYAQPGGNVVQIRDEVNVVLAREAKSLGADVTVSPYWNQATLVADAVRNLRDAIVVGAILAVLVMWFFLGSLRSTLVAATIIPLVIAVAFFFMKLTGQGLNLMTLGGLAVGVGLVIVDAIFVVENIWRHLQSGEDRVTAVRAAMQEIAVPMIGSTITTIVVFLPMALLSGVTGAFFIALSITLTIALALSLLFALYVTPLFSAYFLRPSLRGATQERMPGQKVMDWLLARYEPALRWMLQHRKVAYGISAVVLLSTFLVGRGLGTDFMPAMDEGAFELNFTMPPGTSLEETATALKQLEGTIAKNPNITAYGALTGLDPSGFFPAPQNAGNVRATMLQRADRQGKESVERVFDDLRVQISARVPIMKFTITQILQDLLNDLSNAPATVEIKLFGNNQQELMRLATQVDARIRSVPGVVDDFNGIVFSNPNTLVQLRPYQGSQAGFTNQTFTDAAQAGLNGKIVTTIPNLPVQIPVRLRYDVPWNQSANDLATMPVVAPNGTSYSLGSLANIVEAAPSMELNEENLRPLIRVTANVSGRDLGSTIGDIQKALLGLRMPPGYDIVYGGRYALQQKSFTEFAVAIGIAILLVFLTMIFEFRNYRIPIVIISSVPLSLFGVVIALWVTRIPLNVSSFMGLILLVGGVVKNGILLFDEVDRLRRQGLSVEDQMIEAGRMRMRPIIMTTLTSMLGVVPLALGLGAGSEMQKPLAVATIGGLLFSTFFTLLIMPAFYASVKVNSKFDLIEERPMPPPHGKRELHHGVTA